MISARVAAGLFAVVSVIGAQGLDSDIDDETVMLQVAYGKEDSTSKAWNSWFDSLLVKWREVEPENAKLYDQWLQDTEHETLEACKDKAPLEHSGSIRAKQRMEQFELCQLEWTIKNKRQPPVTVPLQMLQNLVSGQSAPKPEEEASLALPVEQSVSADQPMKQPMEAPLQQPIAQPIVEPAQTNFVSSALPMEQPTAPPMEQPMEQLMQQPMEQPIQQPMEQPIQQPMQQPMMQPMTQPMMQPMQQPMMQPMQFAQMYPQPAFGMQAPPQVAFYPPERTVAFTGLPNFNNAVLGAQGIPNMQNMAFPQQQPMQQQPAQQQQQPAANFDAVKDWERILSFDRDLKAGKKHRKM